MIIPADEYRDRLRRLGVMPPGAELEWKDRDGHVWKITDMADDHLENSMAMMERNAVSIHDQECYRMALIGDDPVIGPRGDAASDAFDSGFDTMMDMDPLEWVKTSYPPYVTMKKVLQFRQDELDRKVKEAEEITPDWLLDDNYRGSLTATEIGKAISENVDLHVCHDCGGEGAFAERVAEFLHEKFGFPLND